MWHFGLIRLLKQLQFQYLKLVYEPKNIQATRINLDIVDLHAIFFCGISRQIVGCSREVELHEFYRLHRGIQTKINLLLDKINSEVGCFQLSLNCSLSLISSCQKLLVIADLEVRLRPIGLQESTGDKQLIDIVKAQMLASKPETLQCFQLLLDFLSNSKLLKLRLIAWSGRRVLYFLIFLILSIAIKLNKANSQVVQKFIVAKCDDIKYGHHALQMNFLQCLVVCEPLRGRDVIEASLAQLLTLDDHVGQNEHVNKDRDEAAELWCLLCAIAAIDREHHLVTEDVPLL